MIRKQALKDSDQVKVTFVLPGDHEHGHSSVVGTFNDWDPMANPLKKRSNGTVSASVTLPAGQRHLFRYLCDGDNWCNDEAADGYEWSEYGSENCVLLT
ncbi:MAG: isoamylase early set domain-containing protein [Chloroflexota bacterium]